MSKFLSLFKGREISSLTSDECIDFLISITEEKKQTTKRNRYSVISTFFNFTRNSIEPDLNNPCATPIIRKMYRNPPLINWKILEKDVVDEIVYRTMNIRNRIILEMMARGGMRIGEVLNLTPEDIQGQKVSLKSPKSGRANEVVYLPMKVVDKLQKYITDKNIQPGQRVFSITYVAAWNLVRKAGMLVGVKLSPHDLRRHAATYASRSGTPIEIVSKVILRHVNLSTTQRYLGKVSDQEATRWIENLHG